MNKFLITGGCGFIGSALIRHIINKTKHVILNLDKLTYAGQFVQTIEKRQGYKIACIEEIAYKNNWINKDQLLNIIQSYSPSVYKDYLFKIQTLKDL